MNRTLAAVVVLLAVPAAAQSGASVCATVLMSDEKVACMQAIAGHTVEPGAAAVCQSVLMGSDKIACLRGTLDKHYGAEELAACRSILMGSDKARCMAAAGYIPVQQPRQPSYDRDDDRDDRRSRRRDRDDDDDDDDDETRMLRVTNYNQGTIDRVYVRTRDQKKFKETRFTPIATNQYNDVSVPNETLEVCAQTLDGFRLYWPKVKRSEGVTVGATEGNWEKGRCKEVK